MLSTRCKRSTSRNRSSEVSQQAISEENEKETFQNEITSLKKEMEELKRERPTKSQIPIKRQEMSYATSKPSPKKNYSDDAKNEVGVSRRSRDQQQQIQIKNVIEFIQKTMVILSHYEKQLRGQFSSVKIPTGM